METSHQRSDTKYQQVIAELELRLEQGVYQAGDKLPSIRQLSGQLGVSKNTVIRAYQELEASLKIEAHPRSGYIVTECPRLETQPIQTPGFVDLLSLSRTVLQDSLSPALLPTGSAHPNTHFPAITSLYAEIGRHSRYQTHVPSHYLLPPGDEQLRKQLVTVNQWHGITASASEILITHGAQQGISMALQALTSPGDTVVIESPCYFGNLLLLESLGLKVVEIPSSLQSGMDLHRLSQALQQWPIAAILLNPSFNNPTGSVMPLAARQQLLAMTQGIPIIEDDVFGDLAYTGRPPTLYSMDDSHRVIYCNSLSKTLDSRLRIGWLLAGRYQPQIEKRLLADNMGSLNLMQSAVAEFLKTGKYRTHLGKIRRFYHQNQRRFSQLLCTTLDSYPWLIGRYHLNLADGGFLCWLTLPEQADSDMLYQQAHQAGISILPGTMFSTLENYRHCLRLSYAAFEDNKRWHTGIGQLAEIIAAHLKPGSKMDATQKRMMQ
ncbi:PLP-dependent aminotransferase family protein [Photobacterium sp. CCB-ST2H9]|uniref:aminotransferase-like domain-containing protein n=1 Tax=Photobacterium sp. CCB-ST2H9 TaxID=2912855 RepID=UPI0020061B01|nr:PLP-dependent aminotransferase family protein [Photobacterium sp. CCB-ST2H9]UTM58449.1 PLP-dependent aminotransferase family protein [Photobacterium sp. CCB-ST2H9]